MQTHEQTCPSCKVRIEGHPKYCEGCGMRLDRFFTYESLCTVCGYKGKAKRITKGNLGMELVLWLLMIIPGLLYSLWRLTTRYDGCPLCHGNTLIPLDSPVAKKISSSNI